MYENRVLREIFGPMREEVKGDWRKLYNEKLTSLPNFRVIKSRKGDGWGVWHVWGEDRCMQDFGWET